MRVILTYVTIIACLLYIIGNVDSKGNRKHSPNDRPRHHRSHNLHRAPYEGFNWAEHGYERNFDPVSRRGHKKRDKAKFRSPSTSHQKLNTEELKKILKGDLTSEEKDEIKKAQHLQKDALQKLNNIVNARYSSLTEKLKHLRDIELVAMMIKDLKGKKVITSEMKQIITPDTRKSIELFRSLFDNVSSDIKEALDFLLNEIHKVHHRH